MKTSSFAGFLDGYQSRNIASIEINLQFKINETIDLINNLISDNALHPEINYFLQRSLTLLNERNSSNTGSLLYSFGDLINMNTSLINREMPNMDVIAKERIRKIIYNFADLAKMSEDSSLISLAIGITGSFIY